MKGLLKKILSLITVIAVIAGTVAVSGTTPAQAATDKSKMKRYTFIKELVTEMGVAGTATDEERLYVDYYRKLFKITDETADILLSKFRITAEELESFKDKYGLSYTNSAYVLAAREMGLLDYVNWKSYKSTITRFAAVSMMVAADEYLHGVTIDNETADYIIGNRISDISSLATLRNRRVFAKGYALGFISGTSLGDYTTTRSCTPNSTPYATTLRKMISMLYDTEARYKLSPDWQMLRISQKDMPKLASYYPYILDSYPNSYYDWEFPVMKRCILQTEHSSVLETDNYGFITWDTGFKTLTTQERLELLVYGQENPKFWNMSDIQAWGAVLFPSEYDLYYKELDEKYYNWSGKHYTSTDLATSPLELIKPEYKQKLVDLAKDYAMTVFNVDYRTIDKNTHWQEVISKMDDRWMATDYLKKMKENKVIVECDKVAADISSLWYDSYCDDGLGRNTVRVYVRYRVVSDECGLNSREGLDLDGIVFGTMLSQQMHSAELLDGGLVWTVKKDNGWQEACFDISVDYDYNNRNPYVSGARIDSSLYYNYCTEYMGGPKVVMHKTGELTNVMKCYVRDTGWKTTYEAWVTRMTNRYGSVEAAVKGFEPQHFSLNDMQEYLAK